jgi:single-stranded-DNA-specific exonuclease
MAVANELEINELMARILLNRNKTIDEIRLIKNYYEGFIEPSLLTNAKAEAKVIASYCKNPNAIIEVFGDYDLDGATAMFIMTRALRDVALCPVGYYCPERIEGYGLSMNFCKTLVESKGTHDILVITVDNGIACANEIKYLKDNGIEVVVTDHHVANENVPDCLIVDPHNHNEPDTFKHLAGCGVAFKVAQLVQQEFEVYNMGDYAFAVALGTLADCMPMSIENIAFIRYGLDMINSDECPEGIKAMMSYMGRDTINANDVGWEIAPRINACGRMGDMNLAMKIFFPEEIPSEETIEDVIIKIEEYNIKRKDFTKKAQKLIEKIEITDDPVCYLDASEYPEGIIGIIANKVTEQFNKTSIVLSSNGKTMSGSARSVDGINLTEVLKAENEKGNIIKFGGHDGAAGLKISKDKFETIKKNISTTIGDMLKNISAKEKAEPELIIDELINLVHINKTTYELINMIPYDNNSFTNPVFALVDMEVEGVSISKSNPNNIQLHIKDETGRMSIWGWGMAPIYKAIGEPKRVHIAGTIDKDFMKPNRFTMKIVDILGAE